MIILNNKRNRVTDNSICAIGSFDGVHRGHQQIVHCLKKHAKKNVKVGIITFFPLPFFVLTSSPIIYLTTKREKERFFELLGVDFIYYFRFTKNFSRLTPNDFVDLVYRRVKPSIVVVGNNFHFGQGRQGSANSLKRIADNYFSVDIMKRVSDRGTISSTRIRELILLGHMKAANKLLGRYYSITGMVVRGKGKGAKIGFPTINMKIPREKLLPLDGVYKVEVVLKDKPYLGAMFCRNDLIEVHIVGFKGNLYRKEVTIQVHRRIRGVEHFTDDTDLIKAIAHDIKIVNR